jgi:polysaccharide export outer membrane protein
MARVSGALALCVLAVASTVAAQNAVAAQNIDADKPRLDASAYAIGPGDHLRLFVWKEPDLSQEIVVRFDGMITVPLIGDVRAAGLTTSDLSLVIQEKLARFVNSPSVTVGLTAQSAQFFIVGRVSRPGAYALDKPTTFLQALALAGGFAEFAKTDHVLVFRAGGPPLVVNYKKLEGGTDPGDNISLRTGDTIVVP